jgi:hypothetical protein
MVLCKECSFEAKVFGFCPLVCVKCPRFNERRVIDEPWKTSVQTTVAIAKKGSFSVRLSFKIARFLPGEKSKKGETAYGENSKNQRG